MRVAISRELRRRTQTRSLRRGLGPRRSLAWVGVLLPPTYPAHHGTTDARLSHLPARERRGPHPRRSERVRGLHRGDATGRVHTKNLVVDDDFSRLNI